MKPRVLMVGRTRYRLPLDASLRPKFDALAEVVDLRVVGSGTVRGDREDATFVLVPHVRPKSLDGPFFYLRLPFVVARQLRRFEPDVVLAQSPYEGLGAVLAGRFARKTIPLVVDVHGDWRTATRLYGSRLRLTIAGLADRLAEWTLREADGVRTVSSYTTDLVRGIGLEPMATFRAYMDLEPFLRPPLPVPATPQALFVGVLEPYKNVDGLAEAWRRAAPRLPGAR